MNFVIAGDPLSGFDFIGPFDTPGEATVWATDNCSQTWIISTMTKPEDYQP